MKQILCLVFAMLSIESIASEDLFSYFNKNTGKKNTFIIFYRPDCPYCTTLDSQLKNNQAFVEYINTNYDITLVDTNLPSNLELMSSYQITSVPTIIKTSKELQNTPEILKGFSALQQSFPSFLNTYQKKNTTAAAVCGNKIIEDTEQCDDGNTLNTDGCTRKCKLGFLCNSQKYPDGNVFITNADSGNCYISIESNTLTWQQAQDYCATLNGYLVTITSSTEYNLVYSIHLGIQWIGANDLQTEGTFKWVSNEDFVFTKFSSGEPNNDITTTATGDCLAIVNNSGTWGDTDCNKADFVKGFICEIPNRCGDGTKNSNEECDDKNLTNGDGCDNNCKTTACGNGIITTGEDCDDGNLINGDGCDATCKLTLSLPDLEQFNITSLYPNPFTNQISTTILLNYNASISFSIIDMLGKTIEKTSFQNSILGENIFDIIPKGTLSSGIYLLKIELTNSKGTFIQTKKIQKTD